MAKAMIDQFPAWTIAPLASLPAATASLAIVRGLTALRAIFLLVTAPGLVS